MKTSNPYTPDETELRDCYALHMALAGEDYATAKADVERGIAKIKADVWDGAYRQGIEDERTAEAVQMGIGPNRSNPCREQEEA